MRTRGLVVAALLAALTGCGHSTTTKSVAVPTLTPTAVPVVTPPPEPVVPDPLQGGDIASPKATLTFYDHPNGKALRQFGVRTALNGRQSMLVAAYAGTWVQVHLPMRPNTATGWVRASQVAITKTDFSIEVVRVKHELIVRKAGIVTARYPVAVGAARTPTPAGLFFVTDLILTGNPRGAYGPAALGLSGRSDVLQEFAGADGILGIHGTRAAWSIGMSVSHGCVRMRNPDSLALKNTVPVGTPVVIT